MTCVKKAKQKGEGRKVSIDIVALDAIAQRFRKSWTFGEKKDYEIQKSAQTPPAVLFGFCSFESNLMHMVAKLRYPYMVPITLVSLVLV
jgi:hypothetical protein